MRGLDTTVLVRYFTQDDAAQARRANDVILDIVGRKQRCAVNGIVLCELVWVLEDAYGFDRGTVAGVLERLLETAQFFVEDKELVRKALASYRTEPGDFSDYLIGWRNRHAGCADTVTFDRGLRKSDLFTFLS
jgi:predicted nucleic-acid-binding protein